MRSRGMLRRARGAAHARRGCDGFSIIELLTVMAIIAILASILLPVLASIRERARRTTCLSHLHQIALALRAYAQDHRGYPLDLLETDAAGQLLRPIAPGHRWFGSANAQGRPDGMSPGYGLATLYPNYVSSLALFNCPNNDVDALGPVLSVDWADPANGYRHYNSYDGFDPVRLGVGGPLPGDPWIGSDQPGGSPLKYRRRPWVDAASAGSLSQYRRMLCWRSPSEDTVVTWCTQHRRDFASSQPRSGDRDLILYANGTVRTVHADPNTGESGHQSLEHGL